MTRPRSHVWESLLAIAVTLSPACEGEMTRVDLMVDTRRLPSAEQLRIEVFDAMGTRRYDERNPLEIPSATLPILPRSAHDAEFRVRTTAFSSTGTTIGGLDVSSRFIPGEHTALRLVLGPCTATACPGVCEGEVCGRVCATPTLMESDEDEPTPAVLQSCRPDSVDAGVQDGGRDGGGPLDAGPDDGGMNGDAADDDASQGQDAGSTCDQRSVESIAGFGDSAGTGVDWSNPECITDPSCDALASVGSFQTTKLLRSSFHVLEVPAAAVVRGIEVFVAENVDSIEPSTARLHLDNAVGMDRSGSVRFDGTHHVFGGPDDSWGRTWTREEVARAAFGFSIAYLRSGGGFDPVDKIVSEVRVRVYYDECP